MRNRCLLLLCVLCLGVFALSQTAEELVNKNVDAKGGLEKIKALKTLRMNGKAVFPGGFTAVVSQESMRPNLLRQNFTLQGMTAIQAYDGTAGWQISPFQGKKDPQLLGEDDLRDLLVDADFDGPMVNYQEKGNKVEFMGHDTVDGDDALRLKVTVKSGDIYYYYLDPDTYLEIRREVQEFIRGSVKETASSYGSYKPVNGVMLPFSISSGPKNDPTQWQTTTIDKIEANVPLDMSEFAVPASLKGGAKK